jgi:hypothetical protein
MRRKERLWAEKDSCRWEPDITFPLPIAPKNIRFSYKIKALGEDNGWNLR